MDIKIITDYRSLPNFEPRNVFQTAGWFSLFDGDKDSDAVMFLAYDDDRLLMVQSVMIQRYIKWLPRKFGSYAVAWFEPWRDICLDDDVACDVFQYLVNEIIRYCRTRALYIEFRHFPDGNVYERVLNDFRSIPWYNVHQYVDPKYDIINIIGRDKRQRLFSSCKNGLKVITNPSVDEWKSWYDMLKKLYLRIHRPLPSWKVFNAALHNEVCDNYLVLQNDKVLGGSIVLRCGSSRYEWYRVAEDKIEGMHPSVMLVYNALEQLKEEGGGLFDFMGAGPRSKDYGVRNFKLRFGGKLVEEMRYRKWLF